MNEKTTPMTTKDAARIQSAQAKKTGGASNKGAFAQRAQRAAAKNQGKGGKK